MKTMTNIAIRSEIAASRLKKYEIAAQMNISDTHFSRMFRRELTAEQINKIRKAITELSRGGAK